MLGGKGLSESTKLALLNANYIAHRLTEHYSLRYKNDNKRVAHELLIDLAEFDKKAGLKVTDFAKRLQVGVLTMSQPDQLTSNPLGLWLPPAYMLLADLDLHAHRAYRVGITGRVG